jgi:hypothetical protein
VILLSLILSHALPFSSHQIRIRMKIMQIRRV